MSKRKGGYRHKSRTKLTKHHRSTGKISLTKFLAKYAVGDKVILRAESAYHKGMFHQRFYGRTGTVVGIRGRCCEVNICDGSKHKTLIVHPVHLTRQ